MGIIKKQSIYGTVIIYVGVIVGFITTGMLFPKFLSAEQIGLINLIISYSALFSQFGTLGLNGISTRLFPYFRDKEKKHNGFLFIVVVIGLIGFVIITIAFYLLKDFIVNSGNVKSLFILKFIHYFTAFNFVVLFFNLLDTYLKALYNAVLGIALKELFQRIFILGSILFLIFNIISYQGFINLYLLSFSLPLVILIIYLIRINEFSLKPNMGFIKKDLRNEMISVAAFSFFTGFSTVMVFSIDKIMINRIIGLDNTGIYSIAFYFGTLVLLPSRAIVKISSIMVADAWKANDLKLIDDIYRKSCITQLVVGLYILLILYINVDFIISYLPSEFIKGKRVIIFISLTNLVNMASGVSNIILSTSKYFRHQTYLILIFAVLVIITNYLLIPEYGISGAAFASLISTIIYNIIRMGFLYLKFKYQPFGLKNLLAVIFAIAGFLIVFYLPAGENTFVTTLIKSFVFTVVFGLLIYLFHISVDINTTINNIIRKAGKILMPNNN